MHFDVLIVGGGMVGLTLARALLDEKKGSQTLRIAIIEAENFAPTPLSDLRVSALNRSAIEQLENWGLWTETEFPDRAPYRHMDVWDQHSSGKLNFHASDLGQSFLGYIVKNQSVIQILKTGEMFLHF